MDLGILPKSKGNKEFRRHLLGERLTLKQMILAKCADCMGYYFDGRVDCQIQECPLYPRMPYGNGSFKAPRPPKQRSQGKTLRKGISIGAKQEKPTSAEASGG